MNELTREAKLSAAFVTLADTLIVDFDVVDLLHELVEKCADILDTEAGGLMLVDAAGQLQLIASTSEETDLVEVMQIAAGAGPCVDCFTSGTAVVVGDIAASGDRWPAFRKEALKQGFLSAHATPMRLRDQVIGTLNLFSTRLGAMGDDDAAVAQALADVATIAVLQERGTRRVDAVAIQLQNALNSRILIEQAKGVLSQSGNLSMDSAFATLRAYAREHQESLSSVAERVISRSIDVLAEQAN